MKHRKLRLLAGLMICSLCPESYADGLYYYQQVEPGKPKQIECDLVAYGGTPASFAATLQAARMGKRAILVSNNGFVGGLTSGGLTAVDWGARRTIGGIAQEFFARARPLKPSVAERTFLKMLSEAGVEVLLDRFLTGCDEKTASWSRSPSRRVRRSRQRCSWTEPMRAIFWLPPMSLTPSVANRGVPTMNRWLGNGSRCRGRGIPVLWIAHQSLCQAR